MNDTTTESLISNLINKSLLCILIPTVDGREAECSRLLNKINGYSSIVEVDITTDYRCRAIALMRKPITILIAKDNKQKTIGEKREYLYKHSMSPYSWQIDDDDDISDSALILIIEAIKQQPDCITFEEHCTIDGGFFSSNHSLEYEDWEGTGDKRFSDGFHYHRTPFFKDVIKTEIARSVPIEHIRFGEDHKWAQALKPHLKTEVHINEYIYYYQHTSSNFTERYGFDRQ